MQLHITPNIAAMLFTSPRLSMLPMKWVAVVRLIFLFLEVAYNDICLVAGVPVARDHCDFKHQLGMSTITEKTAVKVLNAKMPGNAFLD